MNNSNDPKLENLLSLKTPHCRACLNGKGFLEEGRVLNCPNRSIQNLNNFFKRSKETEEKLRKQAAYWLKEVRTMHGKIALLKLELQKFKKKNKYKIT